MPLTRLEQAFESIDDGQYDEALASIDAVLLDDPDAAPVRALRALMLAELDRRDEALSEARRARDVLMAMAVSTLDLIAYIDRDERYQAVNQTWLTYWGCDESKVIGMHVRDRVGPAVYENEIAPLIRRALSGELVRYQHLVRFHARPDDLEVRPLQLSERTAVAELEDQPRIEVEPMKPRSPR